jgi:hypothetical protein
MLEEQALLLRPWEESAGARRRVVAEPATGRPLGFARQQPAAPWLRWLTTSVLEVREAGDEPLLSTVHRFWNLGHLWEVRDADGRRVATVRRGRIEDRLGRTLAVRERAADGSAVWRRSPAGGVLAAATRGLEGLRLDFTDAVADDPFAKMALLAAALLE